MKKPILLFFIFYVWVYALTSCSVLRAEEVKSEKGVCEASGSLDWVEYTDYDGLFYSTKKRTDRGGSIDTSNDWYDGVYSMLNTWTGALENCAGNDYEECSRIIEHMTHLSEQKKTLFNWAGREDWDHIWESTFWNNTSLVVLLNAYKVATDRVEVPADVHSQIGAWMKKAVKSNKQLYLANVNKSFNNHQLQWLRANALYGLLWNDDKALKVSEKGLNTFMKKNKTKEGALKFEAYRGSRGLWYHGRAYMAIFGIADTLEQAGIVVYDQDFKEIDRLNIKSRLNPDVVPSIHALRVNRLTMSQVLSEQESLYEIAQRIKKFLSRFDKCFYIGFNSINFDEEFLRQLFWEHFYYPYITNTKGSFRGDLLNFVTMSHAFNHEILNVKRNEDGKLSFKLENLAKANNFDSSNSHEAIADVQVTMELVQLLKKKSGEFFEIFLQNSVSKKVEEKNDFRNGKSFGKIKSSLRFKD